MRLTLLVLLLLASVAFLALFEPEAELGYAAHWNMVERPKQRCAPAAGSATRWDITGGRTVPLVMRRLRALPSECEGCPAQVRVAIEAEWLARPNFFTGYGEVKVRTVATRKIAACQERFVLQLHLEIEQGLRGEAFIVERVLAKLLAKGLSDVFLSEAVVR